MEVEVYFILCPKANRLKISLLSPSLSLSAIPLRKIGIAITCDLSSREWELHKRSGLFYWWYFGFVCAMHCPLSSSLDLYIASIDLWAHRNQNAILDDLTGIQVKWKLYGRIRLTIGSENSPQKYLLIEMCESRTPTGCCFVCATT